MALLGLGVSRLLPDVSPDSRNAVSVSIAAICFGIGAWITPTMTRRFYDLWTRHQAHSALRSKLSALPEKERRVFVDRLIKSTGLPATTRALFTMALSKLADQWASVLINSKDSQPLTTAFFETYVEKESANIGHVLKHEIVTVFQGYAALVQATVDAARNSSPEWDIVCFTTLTMPVTKWFNFDENTSAAKSTNQIEKKRYPCYTTNREWETYTSFCRQIANNRQVTIERCLVVLADDENIPDGSAVPFFKKEEMAKHLAAPILVPRANDGSTCWHELLPLSSGKLKEVLGEIQKSHNCEKPPNRAIRDAFTIPTDESAYAIIPTEANIGIEQLRGLRNWETVGSAFRQLFHADDRDKTCQFRMLAKDECDEFYAKSAEKYKEMPHDLFAIGRRKKNGTDSPEWMFFLAGRVARDVARVTLEFSASGLNEERFQHLSELVKMLRRKREPLMNLLETE